MSGTATAQAWPASEALHRESLCFEVQGHQSSRTSL